MVVDSRDSASSGDSANKVFRLVQQSMPDSGWIYRLRECNLCGDRTPTVEIQFFSKRPVVVECKRPRRDGGAVGAKS